MLLYGLTKRLIHGVVFLTGLVQVAVVIVEIVRYWSAMIGNTELLDTYLDDFQFYTTDLNIQDTSYLLAPGD